ncbi:MAG TPA: lytic transglycosylase domain-containing protein [candidate division Zixibacteria bacterium]|nr:lytic transglycosylase domain-containing protein [candidate division Zixibacteria bacterium]MDD4918697.1 lytic transglycosylase domain-containing protein [candidate division Zixibacteria bacterium]MDM7973958.1 lytic transglycosylase domain-containing protein [candidate division Zixibacteria bacterium]HOD65799.1 lytic transglycosylase domain-containing protein [candidate division Zixibacteria bacterium]HOZ06725.1 lytic transglycosylase domain-containing protein [candidate division Zixibacteri
MIQFEKLGIFLSKPVAFVLVVIYLLQSGLLVYLVKNKYDLERQISFQQTRIGTLEEKLQIFKAIDDFQIGFSDEEINRLTDVIYEESKKYEYDPLFMLAIILTESSFKKGQTSPAGAQGLMQVMPFVGRDVAGRSGVAWQGDSTLFQPDINIRLGALHLFEQILKFGDVKQALVAYNLGETRLRGILRDKQPVPKTYLNKVLENYKMLKEAYRV